MLPLQVPFEAEEADLAGAVPANISCGASASAIDDGLLLLRWRDKLGGLKEGSVLKHWSDAARVCTWRGVECSASGRVTELSLGDNIVSGPLPTELSCLTELTDVSSNELTGTVPAQYSTLTGLASMLLSPNDLRGSLPAEWSTLRLLEQMRVRAPGIAGTVPAEWAGGMTNVLSVDLGGGLTGALPVDWLTNCSRLEYLSLSRNQFSGTLPVELSVLSSLETLRLAATSLSGALPSQWSVLAGLRYLTANDGAALSGSLPPQWSALTGLRELRVGSAGLRGNVPATWATLTGLAIVDLERNKLSGALPPDLSAWRSVEKLRLNGNRLSGMLPCGWGSGMAALRELSLGGNRLTGTIPPAWLHLPQLETLDLSQNSLTGPVPASGGTSTEPVRISKLYLAFNELTGTIPPELSALLTLRQLSLAGNRLTGSVPPQFTALAYLTELTLGGNMLSGSVGWADRLLLLEVFDMCHVTPPGGAASVADSGPSAPVQRNAFCGGLPALFTQPPAPLVAPGPPRPEDDGPGPSSGPGGFRPGQDKHGKPPHMAGGSGDGSGPGNSGAAASHARRSSDTSCFTLATCPADPPPSPPSPPPLPTLPSSNDDTEHGAISSTRFNAILAAIASGVALLVAAGTGCWFVRRRKRHDAAVHHIYPEQSASFHDLSGDPSLRANQAKAVGGHDATRSLSIEVTGRHVHLQLASMPAVEERSMLSPRALLARLPSMWHMMHAGGKSLPAHCDAKGIPYLPLDVDSDDHSAADSASSLTRAKSNFAVESRRLSNALGEETTQGLDVDLTINYESDIRPFLSLKLGSGAFGDVYLGKFRGRKVAVKLLSRAFQGASTAQYRSFQQEVELLSSMPRHERIVCMHAACLTRPNICIVYELLPTSLHGRMRSRTDPPLSYLQVLRIARDVAEGLRFLHPSIIHRDLKPQNVLLDSAGRAKLIDFGLSRAKTALDSYVMTDAGGTPGYMAPETFDISGRINELSDIYSLAVLMCEMLSGADSVWSSYHNAAQIVVAVVSRGERPAIPAGCPRGMVALIQRCWTQTAKERPSAAGVVRELDVLIVEAERNPGVSGPDAGSPSEAVIADSGPRAASLACSFGKYPAQP
eukprot:jgi/Tetstr1/433336/TSEL_022622.t1